MAQAPDKRSLGQTLGPMTVGLCVRWEGCQAQEGPAGLWGTQCVLYAALG